MGASHLQNLRVEPLLDGKKGDRKCGRGVHKNADAGLIINFRRAFATHCIPYDAKKAQGVGDIHDLLPDLLAYGR